MRYLQRHPTPPLRGKPDPRYILGDVIFWLRVYMEGHWFYGPPLAQVMPSDMLNIIHEHSDWEEWKWLKTWTNRHKKPKWRPKARSTLVEP